MICHRNVSDFQIFLINAIISWKLNNWGRGKGTALLKTGVQGAKAPRTAWQSSVMSQPWLAVPEVWPCRSQATQSHSWGLEGPGSVTLLLKAIAQTQTAGTVQRWQIQRVSQVNKALHIPVVSQHPPQHSSDCLPLKWSLLCLNTHIFISSGSFSVRVLLTFLAEQFFVKGDLTTLSEC